MTAPHHLFRSLKAVTAVAAATAAMAALTACATSAALVDPQHPPTSRSAPAAEVDAPPAPGSTLAPGGTLGQPSTRAQSSTRAQGAALTDSVPAGLTLAVVVFAPTPDTDAALLAADRLADELGATVTHVVPSSDDPVDPDTLLGSAVDGDADVVVVFGPTLLDALDRVSASTLVQQFLVVGAQLPEPTANVTAVVWPGTGTSATGAAADVAPRAREALTAGLAAVSTGVTGYVVALP